MDIMALLQSSVDKVNSGAAIVSKISKTKKKVDKSNISPSVDSISGRSDKREMDAGKRKGEFPGEDNDLSGLKEKKVEKSSEIKDKETMIVRKEKKAKKKEKHRKENERENLNHAEEEDANAVGKTKKEKKNKCKKGEEELSPITETDTVFKKKKKKKRKKEEEDISQDMKDVTLVVDNVNNLKVKDPGDKETGAAKLAKKKSKEKGEELVQPTTNKEEKASVKKDGETNPTAEDETVRKKVKVEDNNTREKVKKKVKKGSCPKSLALEQGPEPSWELGATPREWGGATVGGQKVAKVRTFKGAHYVDIREYYADPLTWQFKPGKKGVSLTREQFDRLRAALPQISSAALPCPDDDPLA